MSTLDIRPARTQTDWQSILTFPWKVYRGNPHWVPPLMSQRRFAFDRINNPIWAYLEAEMLIARRDGETVGIIGAAINHRHNHYHQENVGVFGHFEVYEDAEAAAALLDAAAGWVRAQGAEMIRGPVSFTINDPIGCLLDAYDMPPKLLMPYNPPYYPGFIEAAGFTKTIDLYAWHGDPPNLTENPRVQRMYRIMEKRQQRRGIEVRFADVKRLKEEIRKLHTLYQQSWTENWGYVPPTEREIEHLVDELVPFYDPRMGFFAEKDGEPLGFVLMMPDFNQVLHRAYPRPDVPEWFTLLKALWHWKLRPKIDTFRVLLLGVRPEYRGLGVNSILFATGFQASIDAGYTWGEGSWILETNEPMNQVLQQTGCFVYKTYRVYEKAV